MYIFLPNFRWKDLVEATFEHLPNSAVHRHAYQKLCGYHVSWGIRAQVAYSCPCYLFRWPRDSCSDKSIHVALCHFKGYLNFNKWERKRHTDTTTHYLFVVENQIRNSERRFYVLYKHKLWSILFCHSLQTGNTYNLSRGQWMKERVPNFRS